MEQMEAPWPGSHDLALSPTSYQNPYYAKCYLVKFSDNLLTRAKGKPSPSSWLTSDLSIVSKVYQVDMAG
jgi:hypothetical protein